MLLSELIDGVRTQVCFLRKCPITSRGHQLWATFNCVPLQCARVGCEVKACQGVLASTRTLQVTPGSCYLGVNVIQGQKEFGTVSCRGHDNQPNRLCVSGHALWTKKFDKKTSVGCASGYRLRDINLRDWRYICSRNYLRQVKRCRKSNVWTRSWRSGKKTGHNYNNRGSNGRGHFPPFFHSSPLSSIPATSFKVSRQSACRRSFVYSDKIAAFIACQINLKKRRKKRDWEG